MPGLTPRRGPRGLRQGAIIDRVPIIWVEGPLWMVRPKNTARLHEAVLVPAASVPDAFQGDRGEETVVTMGKSRPAIVISPVAELRRGDCFRVAPIYSCNPGSLWDRRRVALQAGDIPHAVHINAGAGLHAGVVRLDQVAVIPMGTVTEIGGRVVAGLDAMGLALLLDHYSRYVAVFDQSEVAHQP